MNYRAIYVGVIAVFISIIIVYTIISVKQSEVIGRLTDKKITAQKLNSDLDYLLHTIAAINPDPYHNTSKDRISSLTNQIKGKLKDPMTGIEFFRLISPLISAYNDAHLVVNNGLYFKEFEQAGGRLFPLSVIIDPNINRIFLKATVGKNQNISKGKELVSINNISCKSILDKLSQLYPGDSEAYKVAILENGFAICLWKEFGFNGSFRILFKDGSSETVKGLFVADWLNIRKRKVFFECKCLQDHGQDIAYIKLSSLEYEKKQQFDGFLVKSFENIHQWGCRSLIIDIRSNFGGSTLLAKQLFNYITKNPYSIEWENKSFKNGKLITEGDRKLTTPELEENKFTGKVYLLVNATTFSSAYMMANAFKFYKLGTVIGDIGSEKMLVSGEPIFFTLPNSQINGFCPSSFFLLPNTLGKDSRLIPDHVVVQSFEDRLQDKDVQLDFCFKLIGG